MTELNTVDVPKPEELIESIGSIGSLRDRALISLIYLTGGRIREVLAIAAEDIRTEEKMESKWVLITMPNFKNRRAKQKVIPIHLERERGFLVPISKWVEEVKTGTLFSITPQRAWQITKKELGIHPHLLRHFRLTHLTTIYDFNLAELRQFAGWASGRAAETYVHMKWTDLMRKMI